MLYCARRRLPEWLRPWLRVGLVAWVGTAAVLLWLHHDPGKVHLVLAFSFGIAMVGAIFGPIFVVGLSVQFVLITLLAYLWPDLLASDRAFVSDNCGTRSHFSDLGFLLLFAPSGCLSLYCWLQLLRKRKVALLAATSAMILGSTAVLGLMLLAETGLRDRICVAAPWPQGG